MPPSDAPKLEVTVLGSSDAFCSGGHPHATYLVETRRATFLVDCGPTVLLALKRYGIDTARVDFVVISHMHGDHFGGLPFLLLESIYERPRTRPLVVLGPPGIGARVWTLVRALYPDVVPDALPFAFEFVELEPEGRATIADVELHPVRVPHQDADVSLAVGFTSGGKRLLYSGDTPWDDRFFALARDVDLFLCECTAYDEPMGRHIQWTTLAPLVPRLGCRRLVLIHLGRKMREHCGELGVECAREGMRIRL
ncbi:MAG: MBL fold metallo-hydrolase [Deltaproteobacteria bacterium]|nr:MBL fold metallo-hydrolase [Deltaproteobacteria bacterium]